MKRYSLSLIISLLFVLISAAPALAQQMAPQEAFNRLRQRFEQQGRSPQQARQSARQAIQRVTGNQSNQQSPSNNQASPAEQNAPALPGPPEPGGNNEGANNGSGQGQGVPGAFEQGRLIPTIEQAFIDAVTRQEDQAEGRPSSYNVPSTNPTASGPDKEAAPTERTRSRHAPTTPPEKAPDQLHANYSEIYTDTDLR